MAGYTRQSSYTDGDIINAADSNDEFDQLVNVFSNTTGHKHDGTAAEGPVIGLIGDPGVATPINKVVVDDTNNRVGFFVDVSAVSTEQIRVQDGAVVPVTDDDVDLGAVGAEFKNLYIDGTANIDSFVLGTSTAVTSVDTDLTTVSASDDTLASAKAIKTYVDAQVTAQDLDFQADTGGALNIDLDSETLTLTGGTGIDTAGSGNTVTFAIDSTVATLTGTQTLTNKTLTTPIIATISNTGTLTLPTSTDTLVGRATTDTLTNKTIDADTNTISNLEVDNLKSGVLDTDLTSVAATDTTLASAKAIKTYVDAQVTAQDLDFQGDSGGALSIDLDSETLTIAGGTGIDTSGSLNTLTVAIDSTVATLTGTQTLTNKTLTSAVLNGTISGTSIKDEDNMVSDSASHLATQQSIKAYVDAQVGGAGTLNNIVEDTTPQLGGNLDVNGNNIVGATAGGGVTIQGGGSGGATNITLSPGGSGSVVLSSLAFPNSDGTTGQFLKTDGAGQLAFATVTGATGNELENVVEDTTPQLGGNLDTNGNDITFGDNDKAIFGAGSDLSIYHTGSNSYIQENGTGSLIILGYDTKMTATGSATYLENTNSGYGLGEYGVKISHITSGSIASEKLKTTSTGIDVTGTVTADGATIASLTYPTSDGTSGQVLTTNGSGTLSFQNVTETDPSALAFAIALG